MTGGELSSWLVDVGCVQLCAWEECNAEKQEEKDEEKMNHSLDQYDYTPNSTLLAPIPCKPTPMTHDLMITLDLLPLELPPWTPGKR